MLSIESGQIYNLQILIVINHKYIFSKYFIIIIFPTFYFIMFEYVNLAQIKNNPIIQLFIINPIENVNKIRKKNKKSAFSNINNNCNIIGLFFTQYELVIKIILNYRRIVQKNRKFLN